MTRPDNDGRHHAGQGGVLGAPPQSAGPAVPPQAAGYPPGPAQGAGQAAVPQSGPPATGGQPAPGGYPYAAQQAPAPTQGGQPGLVGAVGRTQGAAGTIQQNTAAQQAAERQAAQQQAAYQRAAEQQAAYQRAVLQRAAQQQAAQQAAQQQAAALAAAAPEAPRPGTVYGRGAQDAEDPSRVPSGRLARLRIGWHTVSPGALAQLGVSSPGIGLILGADLDQQPVPIRFFRPETTRIALVGGVWAAQLIAFRALALGANALVMTGDPGAWQGFGERSTGRSDRVTVVHGEQPVRTLGTAQQPMLVIHDLGMVGPSAPMELGPWQTQLTVLRQLDERGVPAVQEGQLVIMQRLGLSEAAQAASALRLTGQSAQLLQVMEDEMLALIGGGADRYVWMSPTNAERHYAGAPRR
jgi:hypothetical protein